MNRNIHNAIRHLEQPSRYSRSPCLSQQVCLQRKGERRGAPELWPVADAEEELGGLEEWSAKEKWHQHGLPFPSSDIHTPSRAALITGTQLGKGPACSSSSSPCYSFHFSWCILGEKFSNVPLWGTGGPEISQSFPTVCLKDFWTLTHVFWSQWCDYWLVPWWKGIT